MELDSGTELKEGGNNTHVHFLPGRTKYSDLTLKRGLVPKTSALFSWCQKTITGGYLQKIQTKDISVKLLDEDGTVLVTWSFKNAWPKKMSVSDLNAKASGDSGIMIETITLAYSEFERKY